MSNWSRNGLTQRADIRADRIAAGTVGDQHATPGSIGSDSISGVIEDVDQRVLYGTVSDLASGSTSRSVTRFIPFDSGTTITKLTELGAGASFTFFGSKVGVLARRNASSSNIRVYIDGDEAEGRVLTYAELKTWDGSTGYDPSTPLSASATTIYLTSNTQLPSSGKIYISGEVISYSSKPDTETLAGCTRGVLGQAKEHRWDETVYKWSTRPSLNLGNSEFTTKEVVWWNPFLDNTEHTIVIGVADDDGIGTYRCDFDGFIINPLIGAKQTFHRLNTITVGSVSTTANGYASLGTINLRGDQGILGVIGYHQLNPPTGADNANTMAKLGFKEDGGSLQLYLHNGPASTTVQIQIVFSLIGETL